MTHSLDLVMTQPKIVVGTTGNINSGKSTLTEYLGMFGLRATRSEVRRDITKNANFTNCTIRERDGVLFPFKEGKPDQEGREVVSFSIPDLPGHEEYMSTAIAGLSLCQYVFLLVSANDHGAWPPTQLVQHIRLIEKMFARPGDSVLIVHNKMDQVNRAKARAEAEQLFTFLRTTRLKRCRVVPVAVGTGMGVGGLLAEIRDMNMRPLEESIDSPLRMPILRSFTVEGVGGAVGGTILQGRARVGTPIFISPGVAYKREGKDKTYVMPLQTTVKSVSTGKIILDEAVGGGLVALAVGLDCGLTSSNTLTGQIVTTEAPLAPVNLIRVEVDDGDGDGDGGGGGRGSLLVRVAIGEKVIVTCGCVTSHGTISGIEDDRFYDIALDSVISLLRSDCVVENSRFQLAMFAKIVDSSLSPSYSSTLEEKKEKKKKKEKRKEEKREGKRKGKRGGEEEAGDEEEREEGGGGEGGGEGGGGAAGGGGGGGEDEEGAERGEDTHLGGISDPYARYMDYFAMLPISETGKKAIYIIPTPHIVHDGREKKGLISNFNDIVGSLIEEESERGEITHRLADYIKDRGKHEATATKDGLVIHSRQQAPFYHALVTEFKNKYLVCPCGAKAKLVRHARMLASRCRDCRVLIHHS